MSARLTVRIERGERDALVLSRPDGSAAHSLDLATSCVERIRAHAGPYAEAHGADAAGRDRFVAAALVLAERWREQASAEPSGCGCDALGCRPGAVHVTAVIDVVESCTVVPVAEQLSLAGAL